LYSAIESHINTYTLAFPIKINGKKLIDKMELTEFGRKKVKNKIKRAVECLQYTFKYRFYFKELLLAFPIEILESKLINTNKIYNRFKYIESYHYDQLENFKEFVKNYQKEIEQYYNDVTQEMISYIPGKFRDCFPVDMKKYHGMNFIGGGCLEQAELSGKGYYTYDRN